MPRVHPSGGPGIAEIYERDVLPALTQHLDQAFPEFGWRADANGWIAANDEFTHQAFGVRAQRIVCHGAAPRGFLIHGTGPVLWTTYVNDNQPARGRDFVEAVRTLAHRAGIELPIQERARATDRRRAELLHDAFVLCRRERASDHGADARRYLIDQRGIPADRLETVHLGLVSAPHRLQAGLRSAGYSHPEIRAAGLLRDDRWSGRICGAWRDEHGDVITLWARTTSNDPKERYLYLGGATRTGAPPYGLADVLAQKPAARSRDVLLVEGVFDVHQLRARGVTDVAALGGAATTPRLFEQLADLGIHSITLCLDNDAAGRTATARAIDHATRAGRAPDTYLIDPDRLQPAKDPDELIRTHGLAAWHEAARDPSCAIAWRAAEHCRGIDPTSPEPTRRSALRHAGNWLASLPPRYAIEQDQAVTLVAQRAGYDPEAVRRTFRARHWHESANKEAATTPQRPLATSAEITR